MPKKIAPNLRWLVEHGAREPEMSEAVEARAEMRALLAVARALRSARSVAYDGPWQERIEAAFKALDRLDRLSGGRP